MPQPIARFPAKLKFLFEPHPYKVAYGGRGGGKSHSFAKALLILGARKKLRILCCREIQKSIKASVHTLLKDEIERLQITGKDADGIVAPFYRVMEDKIIGLNGTEFFFVGLRHNVSELKSMEGIDIVWPEEAHLVSTGSWNILLPTIRGDPPFGPFGQGSEVWISFNPEFDDDPTYRMFVLSPPTGAVVQKVGWRDNPWFPKTLERQRLDLLKRDPVEYEVVWEGNCRTVGEGSIYAKQLREALEVEPRRITHIPHNRSLPVHTSWDLGRRDLTSIWFFQQVGYQHNVIDFYEDFGQDTEHYMAILASRKDAGGEHYRYGQTLLPHDAKAFHQGARTTIYKQVCNSGVVNPKQVRIVRNISKVNGINAVRTLFPRLWFDAVRCEDGLRRLKKYQYAVDPETKKRSIEPLHNEDSHAADALKGYAVSLTEGVEDLPEDDLEAMLLDQQYGAHPQGWMRS